MKAIEVENVKKHFGNVEALKGVTFSAQQGEVVAFLGPNGAGKTTTISIMLGMRAPSSGTVKVFGMNPRIPKARARLGAMLQESDLPATLKVKEAVELFRRLYPRSLPFQQIMDMADLTEIADRLCGNLSGGQRRRLSFALSVCGNPDVLFLDEPTVAMDVQSRAAFWDSVRKFKSEGKTIILTTHHLEEADALSDRVLVIDHGKVIVEGTPRAIKEQVGGTRIRFHGQVQEQQLQNLPGVTRVNINGVNEVYTRAPEAALREILQHDITDLEVSKASLEEAFLNITARN
ncbi:ABC transporter ATP-binding protein [Deinococcus roseus]|uniref:ABC transporter ATP-binding protein n=1 Tax=Deinococcus roseus TaxID=392414 RepID=A0ABQ2CVI8_9DEIO|nr:ABC transporter ATP-binding protein [Deinococcus roseus]GGJ24709.1 ABC transporter ATP-binding protein [Deinococcus roseus]